MATRAEKAAERTAEGSRFNHGPVGRMILVKSCVTLLVDQNVAANAPMAEEQQSFVFGQQQRQPALTTSSSQRAKPGPSSSTQARY